MTAKYYLKVFFVCVCVCVNVQAQTWICTTVCEGRPEHGVMDPILHSWESQRWNSDIVSVTHRTAHCTQSMFYLIKQLISVLSNIGQ